MGSFVLLKLHTLTVLVTKSSLRYQFGVPAVLRMGVLSSYPILFCGLKGGCAKGGYLNMKGDWAIKPQFDGLTDFAEGLAAVNLGGKCGMGGKWGYIDKDGQTIIPFRFLWAATFHDGQACVSEKRGAEEVTDRSGNIIRDKKCR